MRNIHVPTPADFRRLRGYVRDYRRTYERGYREIRGQVFAHHRLSDAMDNTELFARTNVRELQRLLVFLDRFHEALSELLHNGKKPIIRPQRYSVESMRKKPTRVGRTGVHERIVAEAEKFLVETSVRLEGSR
jgi:hypothetical protein